MPTYRTKVGPDGRVQLPAELVSRLKIREDAEVEFFLTLDGDVFFHAITATAANWPQLFPALRDRRVPPISIREMDEGMAEGLVEDDERIRREWRDASGNLDRSAAE